MRQPDSWTIRLLLVSSVFVLQIINEKLFNCISPPGGTYTLPPPINGTNTDASGQDRGGQGPVGVVPTTNSTAAAPTQAGISPNCTKFAYASSGGSCFGFTQSFSISMADFTTCEFPYNFLPTITSPFQRHIFSKMRLQY